MVITPPAQRGGGDVGAAKLVADAIAKMQNAIADKNRNDTLNATCFTIGGLVGPGRISNDDATQYVEQLKQIAIAKGLPFGEAERTAKSGFEGGIGKPLHNRPMTRAATTPAADEDIKIDVTHTIDLSSFAATDYDNAKVFVLLYPDKYRYTSAAGWYRYDEKTGIWRHDDAEAILAKDIADMLEMRQIDAVKARKNDIVSFCKPNAGRIASTRTILESLCFYDYLKFDQNHNFVCCRNGVIDLEKGLLHPHSPEWGFTASLTANLNPDADERLIDDFLMESVKGGEAVVKWFQKTGGSHLTGETRTEAATFVWGPSRAGKGSYVEALKALMGDLCRTLSFSALVEKRDPDSSNFDLAPLRGARLVIADESNRKDRLNGGKLKAMTGGTEINCSFKGKDFFTYQPKFKIMMISNWPPNCDPDDDAAWGRLRVVEFPNSHLGSEDVTIKTRLKTRERQEALLKWLVLGAMAMYAENDGHIMPVPQIATSTNEARNALDTIAQWLDQCTIKRDDLYTESSKLYQNYAQWAENMGYEAKSARNLMSTLRAKGYDTSAQRKVNGVNLRSCNGIGLLI
ncbi:MAG: phage/plasmid primase, P4 family [Anaerolineae bacterium]|nr:phage/plasmid primase, P4 family [Anaerolineae bacterium]